MVMKTPLPNPRLKRSMTVLGWAVFGLALLYVYVLPNWMYPEAFKLVDGKMEALLIGLAIVYLYAHPCKSAPWVILLALAVRESYERPTIAVMLAAVSLVVALTPPGWAGDFSDFTKEKDDDDDGFGDIPF